MKTATRFLFLAYSFASLICCKPAPARSIVLFIGDGMGFEHVQAGRLYVKGNDAGRLAMETLPYHGEAVTILPGGGVTDSATAGTALATGYQHPFTGIISMNEAGDPVTTILERARGLGWRTGLITTDSITGATPAAFGAHALSRGDTADIRNDYLCGDSAREPSLPNILFGGGHLVAFVDAATSSFGYAFAGDAAGLEGLDMSSEDRVLGLFGPGVLTRENDRVAGNREPRLSDMVPRALEVLSKDRDGDSFFLVLEGALIDKISHEGNTDNAKQDLPPEVAEFDAAIQAAYDWLDARGLLPDTLILVTCDHETGSLDVRDGQSIPPGTLPAMTFHSTGHTRKNVPVYGTWPPTLHGTEIDNTETFHIMEDWLAGDGGMPPVVQDLEVLDITRTAARVRWTTQEPSTTWLSMEERAEPFQDSARVRAHEVALTDLVGNTLYTVTVRSTDVAGFTGESTLSFTTLAPELDSYVRGDPEITAPLSPSAHAPIPRMR